LIALVEFREQLAWLGYLDRGEVKDQVLAWFENLLPWLASSSSILGMPWAAVVFAVLSFALFAWNLISLAIETSLVSFALESALAQVRKSPCPLTSKGLQELHKGLSPSKILGEAWTEFYETLIYPDPMSEPDGKVLNVRQSNELLNEATIAGEHLDFGWYGAVPGMLTALGLTGTFVSLYLALSSLQIDVGSGMILDAHLSAFINNLAGKFVSSICGIGFAIVFVMAEKWSMGGIHKGCAALQTELNKRCTYGSQEVLLHDVSAKIQEACQAVAGLKAELPRYINEGLETSVSGPIAQIVSRVDELANIVDEQAKKREESITRLVTTVVQAFKQALFDATNKEFDLLATALSKTSGIVDSLNEKLSQSIGQQESLIKAQKDQTDAFVKGTRDAQIQLMDTLKDHCESLLKAQSTEIETLLQSIQTASNQMVKSNERVSDALLSKLNEHIAKFISQMESNSSKQLQLMQNSHEYMVNNLETWIASATEDLQRLVKHIGEESLRAEESITKVAQNIAALENLAQSNSKISSDGTAVIGALQDILKSVAEANVTVNKNFSQAESFVLELGDCYKQHRDLMAAQEQFIEKAVGAYERLGLAITVSNGSERSDESVATAVVASSGGDGSTTER
jgi:hypothetical protein